MRRLAAVTVSVLALVGVVGAAAPATATAAATATGGGPPAGTHVSGSFSGTSTWAFGPPCVFAHQVFTGTYDPDRPGIADGTYSLEVCVEYPADPAEPGFETTGTFVVTTGGGGTLTGTVSGLTIPTGTAILDLDLTLTVTHSSGTGRPIRGTIAAVGTTDQSGGNPTTVEEGTFTADLRRA